MYGWKMSGGGGGNKNKKVWVYGYRQGFVDLTDIYKANFPDEIINLDYEMETDPRYDCGITDWFVIPATKFGQHSGPSFLNRNFTVTNAIAGTTLTAWSPNDGYAEWAVPGNAYLFLRIAKIARNNHTTPLKYHLFYSDRLTTATESQELHNIEILNELWKSPIPGYGFGKRGQYKIGNMWRGLPGGDGDPDEKITGGVYPLGIPDNMYSYVPYLFGGPWTTILIGCPEPGPTPLQQSNYYVYNTSWGLYNRAAITYFNNDPDTTPIFAKGFNRYLLDLGTNDLQHVDGDTQYDYTFYGFVILGA